MKVVGSSGHPKVSNQFSSHQSFFKYWRYLEIRCKGSRKMIQDPVAMGLCGTVLHGRCVTQDVFRLQQAWATDADPSEWLSQGYSISQKQVRHDTIVFKMLSFGIFQHILSQRIPPFYIFLSQSQRINLLCQKPPLEYTFYYGEACIGAFCKLLPSLPKPYSWLQWQYSA